MYTALSNFFFLLLLLLFAFKSSMRAQIDENKRNETKWKKLLI